MNLSNLNPGRWGTRSWLNCFTLVTFFLVFIFAAVELKDSLKTPVVSNLALVTAKALAVTPQDETLDAPMPVDLYKFALNVLLLPLLDDAEPPRWTEAAIDFSCDPATSAMVNGEPMVAGKVMPAIAFTVRLNMVRCAPLGPDSVELSGKVELHVFHDDTGLSAIVMPDHLQVVSQMGRTWLRGPFAATTSLGGMVEAPPSKLALQTRNRPANQRLEAGQARRPADELTATASNRP